MVVSTNIPPLKKGSNWDKIIFSQQIHTQILYRQEPKLIINLLSVFWNYSSTDCWITAIILIFLLRGGLASLFQLVPVPSCIVLCMPHHHLVMTCSFSLTLMKTHFSHPLGFKSVISTGIILHQNRTEQAFFRYPLLEGPTRSQRESKAREWQLQEGMGRTSAALSCYSNSLYCTKL